jgi:electron transport complex protein RnfC
MRERAADIVDGIRIMLHRARRQALPGGHRGQQARGHRWPCAGVVRGRARRPDAADHRGGQIPTLYPSGGEKQLIKILTGKEVPSHGIPAQIGIVCQNVGTACAVADAVLRGRPLIERWSPSPVAPSPSRATIGCASARRRGLVAASGGYRGELAKLVIGGPMMGFRIDSDACRSPRPPTASWR